MFIVWIRKSIKPASCVPVVVGEGQVLAEPETLEGSSTSFQCGNASCEAADDLFNTCNLMVATDCVSDKILFSDLVNPCTSMGKSTQALRDVYRCVRQTMCVNYVCVLYISVQRASHAAQLKKKQVLQRDWCGEHHSCHRPWLQVPMFLRVALLSLVFLRHLQCRSCFFQLSRSWHGVSPGVRAFPDELKAKEFSGFFGTAAARQILSMCAIV